MAYDNLDPNDTMIVNRGSNSYSVTVDQVSTSAPVLQDDDVFLVNRGDKSFSVTKKIITDEIGKEGQITAPVVVLTPPNGAGLGDITVTPAAEGITDVDQVSTITTVSVWNQDEIWSANQTGTTLGGYPWSGTFDGTQNGLTESTAGSSSGVIFTSVVSGSPIRIKGRSQGTAPFKLKVTDQNGVQQDVSNLWTNDGGFEWITLPESITGIKGLETYSVDNSANYCQTQAVEVGGRLLVNSDITPPADLGTITETSNTATITYTTDNNLSMLTVGQAMTQQPAYTPVTSKIKSGGIGTSTKAVTAAWSTAPYSWHDENGTENKDPSTSLVNSNFASQNYFNNNLNDTNKRGNKGIYLLNNCQFNYSGYQVGEKIEIVYGSGSGSQAVNMQITGDIQEGSINDSRSQGGKSVEPKLSIEITATATSGSFQITTGGFIHYISSFQGDVQDKILEFEDSTDLVNFRVGDVVQTTGTGNSSWNETQLWSGLAVGPYQEAHPITNAFNGVVAEYGCKPQFGQGYVSLTFNTKAYSKIKFNFYISAPSFSDGNIKFNGVAVGAI